MAMNKKIKKTNKEPNEMQTPVDGNKKCSCKIHKIWKHNKIIQQILRKKQEAASGEGCVNHYEL